MPTLTAVPEISQKSSWSNNYTIKVLTQWLQLQFNSLSYSNFEVVDGYEIVYPTVIGNRHDDVCDNHYLYHMPYEDVVLQTVAGKAVLSSILHALCRYDHTNSTLRSDSNHDTDGDSGTTTTTTTRTITSTAMTEEMNGSSIDDSYSTRHDDRQIHDYDSIDPMHLSRYMRTHDHYIASGTIISMVAKKDAKTMIGSQHSSMDIFFTTNESSSPVMTAATTTATIIAVAADDNGSLPIDHASIHYINNNITSPSRQQQQENTTTLISSLQQPHAKTHHHHPPITVYMMWNGLRRQLSIDTLHCYNYTESDIIYINKSIIKAIPIYMPLPVMTDKRLLRTEDMHIICVIDNCTKRFVPSHRLNNAIINCLASV